MGTVTELLSCRFDEIARIALFVIVEVVIPPPRFRVPTSERSYSLDNEKRLHSRLLEIAGDFSSTQTNSGGVGQNNMHKVKTEFQELLSADQHDDPPQKVSIPIGLGHSVEVVMKSMDDPNFENSEKFNQSDDSYQQYSTALEDVKEHHCLDRNERFRLLTELRKARLLCFPSGRILFVIQRLHALTALSYVKVDHRDVSAIYSEDSQLMDSIVKLMQACTVGGGHGCSKGEKETIKREVVLQ